MLLFASFVIANWEKKIQLVLLTRYHRNVGGTKPGRLLVVIEIYPLGSEKM